MSQIILELPIKIRQTVNKDGYVITDKDETEHFFYEKTKKSDKMVYDGNCIKINKPKSVKKNKPKSAKK